MADVEHLTYGLVNPLFAFGMAALGNLLGLILATNSLGHTGRARRRLLLYASLAFGGTGIWVPSLVAMLGFSVPDSVQRYAPQPLAASFGIAVVGVGAGLAVVCTGRIRALRLLLGSVLIGAAIAGTNLALVLSIRVGGTVSLPDNLFATSVGAAMVTAGVIAGLVVGLRRIWVAVAAAALLGLAVTATHYLAMGAVRVELGVEHTPIAGVTPILLFVVLILFSTTALALLWFFTVGTATRSDLRAVFATPHRPIDIEPWMIEEVTARIAIGTSLTPEDATPSRRAPAPRPTPGFAPSRRSRPAWATVAMAANGASMTTNGRLSRADRTNTRTPVPWVSNHPIMVEPAATLSSSMDGRSADSRAEDDTDVHGLGAALVNAALISAALDQAATERPPPASALPVRGGGTTADRTASGLPIRGRSGAEPAPEPATMDSAGGPTVLTEAEPRPDPEATSDAEPASDVTPTAETATKGWRDRWRNRRR